MHKVLEQTSCTVYKMLRVVCTMIRIMNYYVQLVILGYPCVVRSFDCEIMCTISNQIALHSVQLP